MTKLPAGKVSSELLRELLSELPALDNSVVIPPMVGGDAAGISPSKNTLAVTTDPITFTTDNLANLSLAVNSNDIACMGAKPRWFSASLLLPLGTCEDELRKLWRDLCKGLKQQHIQAIGGHTEITSSVNQAIIVGQMIGEPIGTELLNPRHAKPGDKILLWRGGAIEGTAIIAQQHANTLAKHFSSNAIKQMQNWIHEPGLRVWPFVEKLLPHEGIISLHDPTEGGIATALHEVADAAACGLHVLPGKIAIYPETQTLAELLSFNPLGLLASGALLIVCRSDSVDDILYQHKNEPLNVIGQLTQSANRLLGSEPLPRFTQDELVRLLSV